MEYQLKFLYLDKEGDEQCLLVPITVNDKAKQIIPLLIGTTKVWGHGRILNEWKQDNPANYYTLRFKDTQLDEQYFLSESTVEFAFKMIRNLLLFEERSKVTNANYLEYCSRCAEEIIDWNSVFRIMDFVTPSHNMCFADIIIKEFSETCRLNKFKEIKKATRKNVLDACKRLLNDYFVPKLEDHQLTTIHKNRFQAWPLIKEFFVTDILEHIFRIKAIYFSDRTQSIIKKVFSSEDRVSALVTLKELKSFGQIGH